MLIKFTTGGQGGGGTVAEYLLDAEREGRNDRPPEVVRGDMDRTRALIDSIDRQWSYTHGVLSFALEDAPSVDQQIEAMDQFEAFAFAGLDPEQYDITWVRHQHTEGGRVELHFVTPRMELVSGRALNIAPPGWEGSYSRLRDALNLSHGWARPDDPARARDLGFELPPVWERDGFRLKEGREALHGHVTALIEAGVVHDRASMVQALTEAGLEVPRQGKDYLTVKDPETGDRLRLKGRIYGEGWNYDTELGRAAAREALGPDGRDRGDDRQRAEEAVRACDAERGRRAEWHRDRYRPVRERDDGRSAALEMDRGRGLGGADREPVPGDLLGLALDPAAPGAGDAERGPELPERRAGLSRRPGGDRAEDLSGWEAGDPLPAPARKRKRELSDERADSLRARAFRTVQDIGGQVRSVATRVRGAVLKTAEMVTRYLDAARADRGTVDQDRSHTEALERCLGHAEQLNIELGDSVQRTARHVREITHERERHEYNLDRGPSHGL